MPLIAIGLKSHSEPNQILSDGWFTDANTENRCPDCAVSLLNTVLHYLIAGLAEWKIKSLE